MGWPWTVPVRWYSFHADPERYPRTMHSMGSISARRTTMARPASSPSSTMRTRWLGAMSASRSSQKAVRAVRTRPLWGMGSSRTTSKAEMRSDVTMSRRPSPAS
jgi:hypothetical protein